MTILIEQIAHSLQRGRHLVVATILSSSGSTPRTSGSKMLIFADSTIAGTIGGGAVEGEVIAIASGLFSTGGARLVDYDLTENNRADGMDLICGGKMEVLIEHLEPDAATTELFASALAHLRAGRPFVLRTRAAKVADDWRTTKDIALAAEPPATAKQRVRLTRAGDELEIEEPVLPGKTVFICGGGHVSKEIAALTKRLGFTTLVVDDREEFTDPSRFPAVDATRVCPGYTKVFAPYTIDSNCYIVILTRGHSFDREVLAQALRTDAGYIGMIGSRAKRASIYQRLLVDGFSQADLDRVHCPIGLSIGAETPEEIGISVVAELIQHRAVQSARS